MGADASTAARDLPLSARGIYESLGVFEVLKGISLRAHRHEVIAILGASGSGKSTVLRCLDFFGLPTSRSVSSNGEEVSLKRFAHGRLAPAYDRQIRRVRARLGLVFQDFDVWSPMTPLENVVETPVHVLGLSRSEMIEKAKAILRCVGIYERRNDFPAHLSGGQQQHAGIARALATDPSVPLLDEPASALDPELVGDVLRVIRDLADESRTMILVTREMSFTRRVASRVLFFHQGRIEEEGQRKR